MAEKPPTLQVPGDQKERYEKICQKFKEQYGSEPAFYARAPGRVNLIGEHIDYCGYAVLPMAIEQDIVIAAAPNQTSSIHLSNMDDNFDNFTCKSSDLDIDRSSVKWYNYFKCGYRGILEQIDMTESCGLNAVLDGTVPPSAGLSSSSAFVCCAALTTARINNKDLTKTELAEICQRCEKYIGTEGGGMDQAISFLAEPNTAKLIEFNPVRTKDVNLPEGAVFVISNSLVESNKAATSYFNTRVAECRLAAQILAKKNKLEWRSVRRLGDLQNALGHELETMVTLVKDSLHPEPYTKDEVCGFLEVSPEELLQTSLNEKTKDVHKFKLHDRALHVYSEALRVWQFKAVCDAGEADAREELGRLMTASHVSCRDLYECSDPDLDRLVDTCISAGALGSRLTGAGWGGCAVSLVPANLLPTFLKQVTEEYYNQSESRKAQVKQALFATKPGRGAAIYVQ